MPVSPTQNGVPTTHEWEYEITLPESLSGFTGPDATYDTLRGLVTLNGSGFLNQAPRELTSGAALSPVLRQEHDRWGNVIKVGDPRNSAASQLAAGEATEFRYDYLNRMVAQIQPNVTEWLADTTSRTTQPITRNYYDARGQWIGVKDANGNLDRRVFDAGGQLVTEFDALINYGTHHSYDALGRNEGKAQGQTRLIN